MVFLHPAKPPGMDLFVYHKGFIIHYHWRKNNNYDELSGLSPRNNLNLLRASFIHKLPG